MRSRSLENDNWMKDIFSVRKQRCFGSLDLEEKRKAKTRIQRILQTTALCKDILEKV